MKAYNQITHQKKQECQKTNKEKKPCMVSLLCNCCRPQTNFHICAGLSMKALAENMAEAFQQGTNRNNWHNKYKPTQPPHTDTHISTAEVKQGVTLRGKQLTNRGIKRRSRSKNPQLAT